MDKHEQKKLQLGKRIRKLREILDYPQEVVASALGMSVSGYSRIERDEVKLTVDKLLIICDKLNVSLCDLTHPSENHLYSNFSITSRNYISNNSHEELQRLEKIYRTQVELLKEEIAYLRKLLNDNAMN